MTGRRGFCTHGENFGGAGNLSYSPMGREIIAPAAQQRDAPRRRQSAARMRSADGVMEAERRKELA